MPQRFGRSRVAHSRFFLFSRLALTARGHMPRPTTSSHCLAPPPPLLSLLPPLPASQGTLPLPPPFAAGECAATGVWPAATAAAVPRPEKPRAGRCGGRRPAASSFGRPPLRRRETTMAARCPSTAGQGSAGVQTPSRHPHLARDLHQVPSSARATLRAPPRSSAARALRPPRTRSRGEELPTTSLSSPGKPAGRPGLLVTSLLPFFPAVRITPSLASAGSRRQAAARARRWRRQMDKRWWCPVVKQFN
uniref:Uncharacterized protein n=1 Tax=Triticum urartu TaxID=4572 RepID=A0A8R7K5M2_TRIUA